MTNYISKLDTLERFFDLYERDTLFSSEVNNLFSWNEHYEMCELGGDGYESVYRIFELIWEWDEELLNNNPYQAVKDYIEHENSPHLKDGAKLKGENMQSLHIIDEDDENTNSIFDLERNSSEFSSEVCKITTETILMNHLMRAFKKLESKQLYTGNGV